MENTSNNLSNSKDNSSKTKKKKIRYLGSYNPPKKEPQKNNN